MKKLRIGIIGCANIAQKYMIPAINAMDEFESPIISSRSKKKAIQFGKIFSCECIEGYEKLLQSDIDAVYIPLPTGLHEEWIIKALKNGKHVLSEKPLSTSFSSAKKIVTLAKSCQLLIMENLMFQYHLQHTFVKKIIGENQIGEIRFFTGSFGYPPMDNKSFRYDNCLGGGSLLEAGCYPLKAASMFLGNTLNLCFSHLKHNHKGIDIYGGASFVNDVGQIAHIQFGFDNFYQCKYEIWGSTGKVTLERAYTIPPYMIPVVHLEKQGYKKIFTLKPENHFIKILKEFYKAVITKKFDKHRDDLLVQAKLLDEIKQKGIKNGNRW